MQSIEKPSGFLHLLSVRRSSSLPIFALLVAYSIAFSLKDSQQTIMLPSKTVEATSTMVYTYLLHQLPPRICDQRTTESAPSSRTLGTIEVVPKGFHFFLRFIELRDNLAQREVSRFKVASMWRSFTLLRHGAIGFALVT